MGLCTLGLSGGAPVANQQAGVVLSAPGDFATIQLSGTGPSGADNGGVFALFGTFTNATIIPQFVANPAQYGLVNGSLVGTLGTPNVGQNGTWQFLQNCQRNDVNTYLTGPTPITNSTALQITLGLITGFFAVRLFLQSIGSGSILVSGNTNPQSQASVDNQIFQALIASNIYSKAEVLGLSMLTETDLMAAVGGSF